VIVYNLIIPAVLVAAAYGIFRMGNYHLDIMECVGNRVESDTR